MQFVVRFYQENDQQILGSDGSAIMSDIKTLRGVHRRLARYHLPMYAYSYKIFRVPHGKFYDDSAWTQIEEGLVNDLRHARGLPQFVRGRS